MKVNIVRNSQGCFVRVPRDPSATAKICWTCKKEKSLDLFGPDKTGVDGKKGTCRKCESDASSRYNKRNREKVLELQRRLALRKYGITAEEYNARLVEQNHRCKICKSPTPGGRARIFIVDHDHETEQVRGLLCTRCNLVLGHAQDDPELLRLMIEYLMKEKPQ